MWTIQNNSITSNLLVCCILVYNAQNLTCHVLIGQKLLSILTYAIMSYSVYIKKSFVHSSLVALVIIKAELNLELIIWVINQLYYSVKFVRSPSSEWVTFDLVPKYTHCTAWSKKVVKYCRIGLVSWKTVWSLASWYYCWESFPRHCLVAFTPQPLCPANDCPCPLTFWSHIAACLLQVIPIHPGLTKCGKGYIHTVTGVFQLLICVFSIKFPILCHTLHGCCDGWLCCCSYGEHQYQRM